MLALGSPPAREDLLVVAAAKLLPEAVEELIRRMPGLSTCGMTGYLGLPARRVTCGGVPIAIPGEGHVQVCELGKLLGENLAALLDLGAYAVLDLHVLEVNRDDCFQVASPVWFQVDSTMCLVDPE